MDKYEFSAGTQYDKTLEMLVRVGILSYGKGPYMFSIQKQRSFLQWGYTLFLSRIACMCVYSERESLAKKDRSFGIENRSGIKGPIPFTLVGIEENLVLFFRVSSERGVLRPSTLYCQESCLPALLHNICTDTDPLFDLSDLPKINGNAESRKRLWNWLRDKIGDKLPPELLGMSFGKSIAIPRESVKVLFSGDIEDHARHCQQLLDVFFTCYAATILQPKVHMANTYLKSPFRSFELDGVLYDKDLNMLAVLETTENHVWQKEQDGLSGLNRLKDKILTSVAFKSLQPKDFQYICLTLKDSQLKNTEEQGTLRQIMKDSRWSIKVAPDKPLPELDNVKRMLRSKKWSELDSRLQATFDSLIERYCEAIGHIQQKWQAFREAAVVN